MSDDPRDYRRGRHVVFRLQAHLVLVTKYRKGPITDRVRELLEAEARSTCERFEVQVLEVDGEADHLHLLIDYPPKVSLSKLVGAIKTNTSRSVRAQDWPEVRSVLWGEHFWSPSYFIESVGTNTRERIAEYIRNQRKPSREPGNPVWLARRAH